MAANSKIEWTEATWNPVTGCTRVSSGCDNCYAVPQTHRLANMGQYAKYGGLTVLNGKGERHFNGVVRTHEDALDIPLRRKKPTTYFVNSMSDLFHKEVPFEFIDKVFAVMALCPQHTFIILTKRPERMADYAEQETDPAGRIASLIARQREDSLWSEELKTNHRARINWNMPWPPPNFWSLTSCEDQQTADERIPHILRCPAAVRGVSLEPLLGPIDLNVVTRKLDRVSSVSGSVLVDGGAVFSPVLRGRGERAINWVIVGGESGPRARPCSIDWIRSIVGQCRDAGVPCFVKQVGSNPEWGDADIWEKIGPPNHPKGGDPSEWPEDLRVREFPNA